MGPQIGLSSHMAVIILNSREERISLLFSFLVLTMVPCFYQASSKTSRPFLE